MKEELVPQQKVTKVTIGSILSWGVGAILIIAGIVSLVSHTLGGLILLVGAAIIFPPVARVIESKFKFALSGGLRIVLVVVCIILGGVLSTSSVNTNSASTPQSDQPAQKTYQQVFTFSGNGAKKSEPFTIQGDRFKIAYDCKGDPSMTLCQAFVYKVGSSLPQVVMNSPQSVKDETIIYGNGEYYIDANTIGSYTMTVEDYR